MSVTPVLAPVPGRAVRMEDVPDPIFAQSMVGPGAAIDPPRAWGPRAGLATRRARWSRRSRRSAARS